MNFAQSLLVFKNGVLKEVDCGIAFDSRALQNYKEKNCMIALVAKLTVTLKSTNLYSITRHL